jgi:hypothetical protein
MLLGATIGIALLAGTSPPAAIAGGALIETTAPLADRSERSIKAAVGAAIDRAVRGAAAMGFERIQLRDARIAGDEVSVQILATDEPGGAAEAPPDESPETAEPDVTDDNHARGPKPGAPVPAS